MPMFPPQQPLPMQPPPQAFDYQSGWGQGQPFPQPQRPPMPYGGQPAAPPPQLPNPQITANATGGPTPQTQAPIRSGVYSQLYSLGQQAQQQQMQQQQPPMMPPPPPMPGAPVPGPYAPAHSVTVPQMAPQGQMQLGPSPVQPQHPGDRFPRLSRLMGKPILPDPTVGPRGGKRQ
jgi:hypothetical protein